MKAETELRPGAKKQIFVRGADGVTRAIGGCLFDFDGVVVDTEGYHWRAWNAGAQTVGGSLTWEEYLPLKSTGGACISRYVMEKAGLSPNEAQMQAIVARKYQDFAQRITALSRADILPGVERFLQWLQARDIPTAVASSSHTSNRIAAEFGLDRYFRAMFDGNTQMPRKPAPDVFLTAAKAIGVAPADCIVFEDSLAGIEAAINAGMQVIAVGGIRSEKALAHIADFTSVLDLFS